MDKWSGILVALHWHDVSYELVEWNCCGATLTCCKLWTRGVELWWRYTDMMYVMDNCSGIVVALHWHAVSYGRMEWNCGGATLPWCKLWTSGVELWWHYTDMLYIMDKLSGIVVALHWHDVSYGLGVWNCGGATLPCSKIWSSGLQLWWRYTDML